MAEDNVKIVESISLIIKKMDGIIDNTGVPKNVRSAVVEARANLNRQGDLTERVSAAIYRIDDVSNDINLPSQARTVLWNILSMLESIKS